MHARVAATLHAAVAAALQGAAALLWQHTNAASAAGNQATAAPPPAHLYTRLPAPCFCPRPQQCNQVPVQQTKTQCNRVCQQTYTQSIGDSGKGGYVQSYGKGKGRHLLGLIHSMLAGKGGGHVAPQPSHGKGYSGGQQLVSNNCNDVSARLVAAGDLCSSQRQRQQW